MLLRGVREFRDVFMMLRLWNVSAAGEFNAVHLLRSLLATAAGAQARHFPGVGLVQHLLKLEALTKGDDYIYPETLGIWAGPFLRASCWRG